MNNELLKLVRVHWDRVGAWLLVAAGAFVLILGWFGISGTAYPAEQIPYIISAGLVGVFLLGLGAMLWLSADLRDEWRVLKSIDRRLRELEEATGSLGDGGRSARRRTPRAKIAEDHERQAEPAR